LHENSGKLVAHAREKQCCFHQNKNYIAMLPARVPDCQQHQTQIEYEELHGSGTSVCHKIVPNIYVFGAFAAGSLVILL
jgi:hypothetical protein